VRQSTVAAQVPGNVTALLVKAGDTVKAGQVLARIDARDTTAGLLRSQADVAQAEAQFNNARLQWERSQSLKAQGFISDAALDSARAQWQAAQAGVAAARAGRSQAALAQGFATVTAPFDGQVLSTHIEMGDLAAPGRPILTLYAPRPMRAVVQVPASQADQVRTAQRIEVALPTPGGATTWLRPAAWPRAFQANALTPLLALVALLLGLFAVLVTPREEEPQINVTMANVLIAFPGASSRSDVQNMVARPAEQVLSQIAGIEHTYSVSRPGMAVLTVQFKVGVPRTEALVRLYDVLNANQDWLPRNLGALPPVVKPKGIDDVPVLGVTLWSRDRPVAS
jgi:multidrug efflux pump subunit AcrA (membrane-fusion protein)